MSPEKWKELMEESNTGEKLFLYLYRAYLKHPWWIYGFFVAFCVAAFANTYEELDDSGEVLAAFIFIVGFGPVFFFFGMKVMTWIILRSGGIPADYLRDVPTKGEN